MAYIRNKETGELHNKTRDERCNADDIIEENKERLTWAEVKKSLREMEDDTGLCGWCWIED
jgi:hypothetical protein